VRLYDFKTYRENDPIMDHKTIEQFPMDRVNQSARAYFSARHSKREKLCYRGKTHC